MIALVVVIGIAVALSVAGWVSLVRGSFVAPAAPQRPATAARVLDDEPDAVTVTA